MVRSTLSRYFFGISIALLFIVSGFMMMPSDEMEVKAVEPTRSDGPIVNRSTVTVTLYEGFSQFSGEYFYGTSHGSLDLFFDPNYEWKDSQIQPPHQAFEVSYPWGYNRDTTPIKVEFIHYHGDVNFGMATVTCEDNDFNSYIYGQDHYKVTVTAWNGSGSATSEIWFEILNVNDRPTIISSKNFFSIEMDEDTIYDGINEDHDQLDDIFGDLSDPDDVLTFTVEPVNDLASPDNITVELDPDGSSIIFRPAENWACPYVPSNKRLSASNTKFAKFQFNISDQDEAWVIDEGGKLPILRVYVGPLNDIPVMEIEEEYTVNEGVLARIQFRASDVDPPDEQELKFGTNVTTIINERTGIQLEFEEGYGFDSDDGLLEFNTNNKMVGVYPVAAWVRDRPTEELGTHADYPTTPYRIYSNFTLRIENKNDPPTARMSSPSETYIYNTTYPIEFNASRTLDPDLIHDEVLTFKWYSNGVLFGEGEVINHLFDTEGIYNIKLNVSDGEFFSIVTRTITVEKTRILGEIFEGKAIDKSYSDNVTDPLALHRSQEEMFMEFGGKDSIDILSVVGYRDPVNPKLYKIMMTFGEEMEYLFTEQKQQEPVLTIYFLTPDFQEDPISVSESNLPSYNFPVPTSNYRYNKMQFDLRNINVLYYPLLPDKQPGIRKLDTEKGVEITLTVAELDEMNVNPDFVLYTTVEMKTTVTDSSGKTTIITAWDAAGFNSTPPQVKADVSDPDRKESEGLGLVIIIVPIIIVVLIIIGVLVLVLVMMSKKRKEADIQEPMPMPTLPEQSVEQMIFGDVAPQTTAEQLYGAPAEQPQALQGVQPEGLPPGDPRQVQGGQITPTPGVAAPPPEQPSAQPPVEQQIPAPAEQMPEVTLPDQQ